ncbi:ImmA/IrrE family metallo-endopeptidase [Calycomorphotria hydatis]|uniref:IrrE N-terminal-like domain-containing protein n=1 Tax=Calycomorphotria hydatis TaxID=2528027 RepID=A0A517TDH0_9PLAN|nr:ImmA/IrrE family metallo-endopeptidase [Calycomorphotria hydatis]QDT66426.1 hypothetical protein V22_36930 [Calycomorphotria hydatis]
MNRCLDELVLNCLNFYSKCYPEQELPVDIEAVAKELGVKEITERDIPVDGYLGRNQSGELVVRCKSGVARSRKRFTVAHEIGHILISLSLSEQLDLPVARSENKRSPKEELLANRIAASILMPEKIIHEKVIGKVPHWSILSELADVCDVSIVALLRRIPEALSAPAFFFWLEMSEGKEKFNAFFNKQYSCFFSENPKDILRQFLDSYSPIETVIDMTLNDKRRFLPVTIKSRSNTKRIDVFCIGWLDIVPEDITQ